ncbi:MAG: MBL fold metallo-hydrolase [candidate division WOR-3 bacterium]|nr:MAG: MBL fold metallo-hydrolase [candidate division WOR-3 bacterium]
MKARWLGHSAFLLSAADNTKIITDPYVAGSYDGALGYGRITETADGVSISHDHPDHSGQDSLPGNPKLVKGTGEHSVGPVSIKGFQTWHDASKGAQRGENTVFTYEIDGLRVCHLGDLGHLLDDKTALDIGQVDVLLVPVGGFYTIDAKQATEVARQLRAKVIIPMHYKTRKLGFDIAGVEGFLSGKVSVRRVGGPEVEIAKDRLPAEPEIWVLEHAL